MSVVCTTCEIEPTTREDGICYGCMLAVRDDTGPRGLGESPYDLEASGGGWVNVGGVQVWQVERVAA